MGRPRKNKDGLVGRAGRQVIEQEDLVRATQRWKRKKEAIARLAAENSEASRSDN